MVMVVLVVLMVLMMVLMVFLVLSLPPQVARRRPPERVQPGLSAVEYLIIRRHKIVTISTIAIGTLTILRTILYRF